MAKSDDQNDKIQMMLGYLCISTEIEASLVRKVEILDKFDLEDSKIAIILGCKTQAVRDARQRAKRNRK